MASTTWDCPIDPAGEPAALCEDARRRVCSIRCFHPLCKRCYPHGIAHRCGTAETRGRELIEHAAEAHGVELPDFAPSDIAAPARQPRCPRCNFLPIGHDGECEP